MCVFSGWIESGVRNTDIEFDLESTPLQILTDSRVGSGELLWVRFDRLNGGVDHRCSIDNVSNKVTGPQGIFIGKN